MLVEKWFLPSIMLEYLAIFSIHQFEHMFGQTTRKLVKILILRYIKQILELKNLTTI